MFASTRLLLKNELGLVRRWVRPAVSRSTDSLYSVADQALLSATNFSIGMYFVHFSTKDEYGLYALSYGVITLVISFAGALIMTPMTVNYADRPIEQRESYCTSMLVGQYAIFLPAIALVLLAVGCLYQAGVLDLDTCLGSPRWEECCGSFLGDITIYDYNREPCCDGISVTHR